MASQLGKQTMTIHRLANISKRKVIQSGQLIEHNIRSIFLEKWYTKYCRKTSLRQFSKKLKLRISLDQQSKVGYSLFLLYAHVKDHRNKLELKSIPLAFTSYKAFSKNKNRSGTSLPASFSA